MNYEISEELDKCLFALVDVCTSCGLGNVSFDLYTPYSVRFVFVLRSFGWQLSVIENKNVKGISICFCDVHRIVGSGIYRRRRYGYTESDLL